MGLSLSWIGCFNSHIVTYIGKCLNCSKCVPGSGPFTKSVCHPMYIFTRWTFVQHNNLSLVKTHLQTLLKRSLGWNHQKRLRRGRKDKVRWELQTDWVPVTENIKIFWNLNYFEIKCRNSTMVIRVKHVRFFSLNLAQWQCFSYTPLQMWLF